DLVPSLLLVIYVLLTAKVPHWAYTSLEVVLGLGFALLTFGIASARLHQGSVLDELSRFQRVIVMARQGLGVLKSPLPALVAAVFQCLGWLCQLLAVYSTMHAFHIHAPLPAAALVLVLMNIATLFPLWPGNIGLVQAAVALPLISYGVAKARGIAFGFGLQGIEASVGVGVGMLFLAREGLSFAMLRVMPGAEAIPLDPRRLDPLTASSRGLGELIARVEADRLFVCLGGTANVDGGAGLREVVRELPAPTTVFCDALVPLRDAARRFAPQKGA